MHTTLFHIMKMLYSRRWMKYFERHEKLMFQEVLMVCMAIEKAEGKVYEYDAIKREETGRLGKASHTQNYALN